MKAKNAQEAEVYRLDDNGPHSVQLLIVPDNGWAESIELTPLQARRLAAHLTKIAGQAESMALRRAVRATR